MSTWLLNVYMDTVTKEVKTVMGRIGVRLLEEGREWRLFVLLYEDDLVLCGDSEEDLKEMVGSFDEVCRRSGVKLKMGKRD